MSGVHFGAYLTAEAGKTGLHERFRYMECLDQ
jgi:hypothetical protein